MKLFKAQELKFRKDCFPHVIYMCSVINSCVTAEQLESAFLWAYKVLQSWEEMDEKIALKQSLAYEWVRAVHDEYGIYYKYIKNAVSETAKKLNGVNAQD